VKFVGPAFYPGGVKPLCACGGRATTTLRNQSICQECLAAAQDHEQERRMVNVLYDTASSLGSETLRNDADEAAERNRAEQTR